MFGYPGFGKHSHNALRLWRIFNIILLPSLTDYLPFAFLVVEIRLVPNAQIH